MKILRPAGVIFFSVALIVVIIFNLFFLNSIIKNIIIKTGEEIFKAAVEVKKVNVDLTKSKIAIEGIQIADKNNEFRNIFEADKIIFDYQLIPLFSKKVIIDNIELIGFGTNTKREKSGKLPEKRINEIEKKEKKQNKENKIFNNLIKTVSNRADKEIKNLPITKTINKAINLKDKKIEELIKKEELESYKTILSMKSKIEESRNNIQNDIKSLNIDNRLEEIKKKADNIKSIKISEVGDIPTATTKLKELEIIKNEIDSLKKDTDTIKNNTNQFINFTTKISDNINSSKEKDIQMIMSKMDIDILNAKDIETALIGPLWKSRIDKIIQIINVVNKYIPAGNKIKKKRYNEIVRKKGSYIKFVSDRPSFWIKDIKISKSNKTDGVAISGTVTDLCFEQNIINKPCVVDIIGRRDNKLFNTYIKIDRIDKINDNYLIKMSGFNTEDLGFNNIDYGNIKFYNGIVDAEIKANIYDNKIKIEGNVNISQIKFDAKDKQDILYTILSNIDNIKIGFDALALDSGVEFNVNSDLFNQINTVLKKIYGKKIQEANKEIEKQIDILLKKENEMLAQLIRQSTGDIKNNIDKLTKNINTTDAYIENIKSEIIKKIDNAKKGAAKDVLKGLFK